MLVVQGFLLALSGEKRIHQLQSRRCQNEHQTHWTQCVLQILDLSAVMAKRNANPGWHALRKPTLALATTGVVPTLLERAGP